MRADGCGAVWYPPRRVGPSRFSLSVLSTCAYTLFELQLLLGLFASAALPQVCNVMESLPWALVALPLVVHTLRVAVNNILVQHVDTNTAVMQLLAVRRVCFRVVSFVLPFCLHAGVCVWQACVQQASLGGAEPVATLLKESGGTLFQGSVSSLVVHHVVRVFAVGSLVAFQAGRRRSWCSTRTLCHRHRVQRCYSTVRIGHVCA
jgi:hypothetical protein